MSNTPRKRPPELSSEERKRRRGFTPIQLLGDVASYCPICKRIMIDGPSIDDHHLIPKTFGGKDKVQLHKICHRKIHSLLTDRELQHIYHTVQTLLEHEGIQKFVKWVSKKDPEFYDVSKDTQRIRNRKRKR